MEVVLASPSCSTTTCPMLTPSATSLASLRIAATKACLPLASSRDRSNSASFSADSTQCSPTTAMKLSSICAVLGNDLSRSSITYTSL